MKKDNKNYNNQNEHLKENSYLSRLNFEAGIKLIGPEPLAEMDYINEIRDNYNIILENGNEVVYSVIDNFCYDISNYIDDNMEDENENEENINALLNYIKNKYNYFGEFDRVIIDKLMEEILED